MKANFELVFNSGAGKVLYCPLANAYLAVKSMAAKPLVFKSYAEALAALGGG